MLSSQTEADSCRHNDFAWFLGSSFPTACFVPAKGVCICVLDILKVYPGVLLFKTEIKISGPLLPSLTATSCLPVPFITIIRYNVGCVKTVLVP